MSIGSGLCTICEFAPAALPPRRVDIPEPTIRDPTQGMPMASRDWIDIDSFEAIDDTEQFDRPDIPRVDAVLSGAPERDWQQFFIVRARALEQSHPGLKMEILADRLGFHTRASNVEETCRLVHEAVQGTNQDFAAQRAAEEQRIADRNQEVHELMSRVKTINSAWPPREPAS
jgi:hypothetical protein